MLAITCATNGAILPARELSAEPVAPDTDAYGQTKDRRVQNQGAAHPLLWLNADVPDGKRDDLQDRLGRVTPLPMLHAYAGIVTNQGLKVFVREERHTLRFLQRWARRQQESAACFWAVLTPTDADLVVMQLYSGPPAAAWRVLRATAFQLGPVPPTDEDEWAA